MKSAKSAKAGKLLKLTKLNRVFKMFRAVRTVKIMRLIVVWGDILHQTQTLITRIFTCIPLIFKLLPILWMVFYIYAVIGLEIFNSKSIIFRPNSPY